MRLLRRVLLRKRARRAGEAYTTKIGYPNTPQSHTRLIRFLRLAKGKPAFDRPVVLREYSKEAADCLETYMLTTGRSAESSPHYPLCRLSRAIDNFRRPDSA